MQGACCEACAHMHKHTVSSQVAHGHGNVIRGLKCVDALNQEASLILLAGASVHTCTRAQQVEVIRSH